MHLLAHGGMLPRYDLSTGEKKISPRRRGVKQGAMLMLIGAVVVPLLAILASFAPDRIGTVFEYFTASAAIIFFLGGPLRMLFAAIFEEGAKSQGYVAAPSYIPPAMPAPQVRVAALPPTQAASTEPWRQRPQTAEMMPPSSVPEHTTKLLEKSEPDND